MEVLTASAGSYPKISDDPKAINLRRELNLFDRGEIGWEELELAYKETIRRVLKEQEEAGLDILTDGQIRWDDLVTPFAKKMDGVEIGGLIRFFDNNFYYRQPVLVGPVRLREPATVNDFRFASSLTKRPMKAVIPGPYTMARLCRDNYYKDLERLTLELARALRDEALALKEAGATILQIDEPSLCFNPEDAELAKEGIKIITDGLTLEVALCLYFGSIKGLLGKLSHFPVQVLILDLVSRGENLEELFRSKVPQGLGLGLIDARNTKMERREDIIEILRRVSKAYPDRSPLYLTPNCGLEFLPHREAFKKMQLMVSIARRFNEGL